MVVPHRVSEFSTVTYINKTDHEGLLLKVVQKNKSNTMVLGIQSWGNAAGKLPWTGRNTDLNSKNQTLFRHRKSTRHPKSFQASGFFFFFYWSLTSNAFQGHIQATFKSRRLWTVFFEPDVEAFIAMKILWHFRKENFHYSTGLGWFWVSCWSLIYC